MFISIYAAGLPFNGATIPGGIDQNGKLIPPKSLGGSESAAYYVAKELAALGHTVTVFTTHPECGNWDGVRYEHIGNVSEQTPLGHKFQIAMRTPQDVVVIQRTPNAFNFPPNSKLNIWWLHDIALHRVTNHTLDNLVNVDAVFTVSEWHKNQVSNTFGINKNYIYATRNGVDYDAVERALSTQDNSNLMGTPLFKRQEKHLLFASRPERGLEALVGKDCIMEMLPDYTLYVAGYDNYPAHMKDYYTYLFKRCEELPNVQRVGHLSKEKLYKLMASCQATVYPTMFEDTSNIICMESAACGTPFIGMKVGAVPETTKFGRVDNSFAQLLNPVNGNVDNEKFALAIKSVCENKDIYDAKVKATKKFKQPWKDIAKGWDTYFNEVMANKCKDDAKLMKHFEHNSDIVAMRNRWKDDDIEKVIPGFKRNYYFLIHDDFANHYKKYYEYEKARGVKYGPEDLNRNPRFICTANIIKNSGAEHILDYGCAHGHYTVNLAKNFPNKFFTGIDLAESNVKIGNKWIADEKLENAKLVYGSHTTLEGMYDLIMAEEVLEHVARPQDIVDELIEHLNPGGDMIISVPFGPWESYGYKEHEGWRAHIHHLERQDLKEMFGHFDDYKCLAIPHRRDLGHYVLSFTKPNDDRKCGEIDYNRKLKQQSPLESLSVCMIVKDGELTLPKSLSSVADFADEIIIGIDETTTDDTQGIINKFKKKYNIKSFFIKSPIEIGFDEARNLTIEVASSDWILWMDADEVFQNAELINFYLRNNCYEAYLINQHHFSVEPLGVLETDKPCRIFRNNRNLKFRGVVHEHPTNGNDLNKGPEKSYVIPNIHIIHDGYATENARRGRFMRNFPLMERDRKKHPDRHLGHFLFVRDLSHLIGYNQENNGGVITEVEIGYAKEAVSLWEKMVNTPDVPIRMILKALPYYSNCAQLVGGKIKYEATIQGNEIKGLFTSTDIVNKLILKVNKEAIDIYNERYL